MVVIPVQALPNQTLQAQLGDQACTLNVYQLSYGLFIDVYVNNAIIIGGVIALNLNRIVRSVYLGFVGDLVFVDTQGTSDPVYNGLGSRFFLVYLDETEIDGAG